MELESIQQDVKSYWMGRMFGIKDSYFEKFSMDTSN